MALFASGLAVSAQTNDSISKELGEVVVNAQMQQVSASRTGYVPNRSQKAAAQSAIDLLRQMAIPQIRINPVTDAVTNNAGEEVKLFINFLAASKEEIEGFRADDVRRVEYIEFPSDSRFQGAKYVINIIIKEYAHGGYTKFTANENFLIGFSSRINVFSKLTYKNMTYDLFVGTNNWNNRHNGNEIEGIYSLKDDEGHDYTLTRKETLSNSHFKQNQIPLTFRATYSNAKVQIRNMLAYMHQDIPTFQQSGSLTYSPFFDKNYTFNRINTLRNNFIIYQGSCFLSLPNRFSLDITPSFSYAYSNDNLAYSTSKTMEIIRNAREKAFNYRLSAYLRKNIGQKHSVMFGISGGDNINDLGYAGTNSYSDRLHNAFASGKLCYNFRTRKMGIYADGGVSWEGSDINGHRYNVTYPFANMNFSYSPNSKNSFSCFLQYATNRPGIAQKTSDILKENEYMNITGNPLLKNSRNIAVNFSYSWMPSNKLSFSAFGNYLEYIDRQMMIYEPYYKGQSLLRSYINSGNYMRSELGIAANWKLMGGKLQVYVSPKQSFYKSTGIYDKSYMPFSATAQLTFYLNKLYFQTYYQSPQKSMFEASPQIHKDHNFHSLTAGWANSSWNIKLMAANVFNKGWHCSKTVLDSPLYTEYKTIVGNSLHPRINITATYAFSYGKKVNGSNEIGEQYGSASSAILK